MLHIWLVCPEGCGLKIRGDMPRTVLTEDDGNKALDAAGADIKYLFSRHEVSIDSQKLFFHHGVTTLEKLSNFAKDRDDLTTVLKEHWELDAERALDERAQVAAISCAFSNAKTRSQRAVEVDAEYDSLQWSRPVVAGEWAAMRSALEKRYGHLEDKVYPAKEYVEKKLAEIEGGEYRAEELTEVVSKEEIEPDCVGAHLGLQGPFGHEERIHKSAGTGERRRTTQKIVGLEECNGYDLVEAFQQTRASRHLGGNNRAIQRLFAG